jgi:chromosome segregation ATPase
MSDAVKAFWVLSVCGGAAFFCVGWFLARLRAAQGEESKAARQPDLDARAEADARAGREAPAAQPARPLSIDDAQRSLDEVGQLEQRTREAEGSAAKGQRELASAKQELALARAAVQGAQDERAQLRARAQSVQEALERSKALAQSAQDELAQLRASAQDERTQLCAVPREAEAPRGAIAAAKAEARQLAEQRAQSRVESPALGAERDRLTAENARFKQEIHALRASQNDPDAAADRAELRELRWRVQATESRGADAERVLDENAKLTEALRALRAEQDDAKVASAQAELRELRLRVNAAEQKGADLEEARQQLDQLREQLAELGDFKEAQGEATRLRALNKQLVLETVAVQRRLDDLCQRDLERQEQVAELDAARREAENVETLRAHVRALEAQLYALAPSVPPAQPAAGPGRESGVLALPSIDPILAGLLASGMAKTAVVADRMGLLVAGAGDRAHQEGLAAMGAMAEQLAARARENLPVTTVRSVCLTDSNDLVMGCRPLAVGDGTYTLCTLGVGPLREEEIARAGEAVIRAAQ